MNGAIRWRRGSRSGPDNNCAEVARVGGGVLVRDSKRPDGGVLVFPCARWDGFLASLRR
ncbi:MULTISPECIES: DUF397 domain-containing protein [Actinosynnema]|uniref:DUF397 domain-containing protein n=1 Tax=Actinosynnema TaxID=40566 RepID=UPI0020A4803D|nr:DUF397 domain-containing protein [Actinosynnema pretiosum]